MNSMLERLIIRDFEISRSEIYSKPEEINSDLELLLYAMNTAYPGRWKTCPNKWSEIKKRIQTIKHQGYQSSQEIGGEIADILWELPDGHLQVRLQRQILGKRYEASLRQPSTGPNTANDSTWHVEFKNQNSTRIAIVGISSFPQSSDPSWDGFSEAIDSALASPNLIVDLRGNPGGDDTKALEMVSRLRNADLDLNWVTELSCISPEAYALQANTYANIIWRRYQSQNLPIPQPILNRLSDLLGKVDELKEQKPKYINHQDSPRVRTNDDSLNRPVDRNVFVLIDSATASSGEWAALYLKKLPNTMIVGENSYGMIHYGNSGLLRLPNSKLDIILCMKINELSDGSNFEKTGIPPDIRIRNQNSLDFLLANGIFK